MIVPYAKGRCFSLEKGVKPFTTDLHCNIPSKWYFDVKTALYDAERDVILCVGGTPREDMLSLFLIGGHSCEIVGQPMLLDLEKYDPYTFENGVHNLCIAPNKRSKRTIASLMIWGESGYMGSFEIVYDDILAVINYTQEDQSKPFPYPPLFLQDATAPLHPTTAENTSHRYPILIQPAPQDEFHVYFRRQKKPQVIPSSNMESTKWWSIFPEELRQGILQQLKELQLDDDDDDSDTEKKEDDQSPGQQEKERISRQEDGESRKETVERKDSIFSEIPCQTEELCSFHFAWSERLSRGTLALDEKRNVLHLSVQTNDDSLFFEEARRLPHPGGSLVLKGVPRFTFQKNAICCIANTEQANPTMCYVVAWDKGTMIVFEVVYDPLLSANPSETMSLQSFQTFSQPMWISLPIWSLLATHIRVHRDAQGNVKIPWSAIQPEIPFTSPPRFAVYRHGASSPFAVGTAETLQPILQAPSKEESNEEEEGGEQGNWVFSFTHLLTACFPK